MPGSNSRTFSRLPTLMATLDMSHDDQTLGEPSEVTQSEDDARPGYGLTGSTPSERTGLLTCLLKKFKRKRGKNMIDTQCEHTDGIPSPTATTGDSLTAEGASTAGNASKITNDRMNLPRILMDCHAELQSLSKKLETKNVHASRKEALGYAFKQGEVNRTLDNLQMFQQQLVVALSIDQARLVLEVHDNQRRQDIYNWLAAPDYESKHLNAVRKWEEHTGSWFLQGESFHEWLSQPESFLWLHGKAGAGKTILW
ncbi:hypothetical protein JB92DRAFT_3134506 [Gautieria morchelliformis]|nr:hypothetical protein JB92DRAFT_3134506 [Gautieria morchelliformis]